MMLKRAHYFPREYNPSPILVLDFQTCIRQSLPYCFSSQFKISICKILKRFLFVPRFLHYVFIFIPFLLVFLVFLLLLTEFYGLFSRLILCSIKNFLHGNKTLL